MTVYPLSAVWRPARWSIGRGKPTAEPVTLSEMKDHLRVEVSDDDSLITQLIADARELVERMANRALMTQSWTFRMSGFPAAAEQIVELPGGTLQSVSQVQYVDTDGVTQTWAAGEYVIDTDRVPGALGLGYGKSWPSVRAWDLPVTITCTVGYGDAAADVPGALKQAIRLIVGDWYENREDRAEVMVAARRLVQQHRVTPVTGAAA